jgi:DNA gyrase subunit A
MGIVKEFGTPRRTRIETDASDGVLAAEDVIPNAESLVTFSRKGYLKRMGSDTFSVQVNDHPLFPK